MDKNRFAGLTAVKTLQESDTIPTPKKETKARQKVNTAKETTAQTAIIAPRRGRPNGKRSNKDFRQVTAYVGTETYKQTKMKLFAADERKEFSTLVDELLNKWLKHD
jgi:endonuclease I